MADITLYGAPAGEIVEHHVKVDGVDTVLYHETLAAAVKMADGRDVETAINNIDEDLKNSSVFIAVYSETPVSDIEAAYQAGKKIGCYLELGTQPSLPQGVVLSHWRRHSATKFAFSGYGYGITVVEARVDGDTWSRGDTVLVTQDRMNTKANLLSPAFTGTPTAPTAAAGTNTNQIATTAFVQEAVTPSGFVAEYQVTTAQEIIAYLNGGGTTPIVIKRNNDYYTTIISQKIDDTKVSLRTFGSLSGSYYIFTYTITNDIWASSSHGLQNLLESGTNIKTINTQSLLGSGDISV